MLLRFYCLFTLILNACFLNAQTIENGSFEQKDSYDSVASGWKPNIFGDPGAYKFSRLADSTRHGGYTMCIERAGNGEAATLTQKVSCSLKQNIVVRFTGSMKTTGISAGRAYFFMQGFDEKGYRVIKTYKEKTYTSGSHDWQTFSADFFLPEIASYLIVGCALEGNGKVLFDDLKLEQIPVTISQTPVAKSFIKEVMDSISRRYLYKDSVDMNRIRTIAYAMTANAKTTSDCYDAVWAALYNLGGDHHSLFMSPSEIKDYVSEEGARVGMPVGRLINKHIAYITVPTFLSMNRQYMKLYVDSMHALLRQLDRPGLKGWIVDVRNNAGGSNIPMLAGIGPLAGEGMISGYKEFTGVIDGNYYNKGINYVSENGKDTIIYKNDHPYILNTPNPNVALLFNGKCGSSGESVVLSFLNRPHTKSFGEPTAGLTTGNGFFKFSDGSGMALTEGIGVDRKGNVYVGKIKPDVLISDDPKTKMDEVVEAAVDWLESGKY